MYKITDGNNVMLWQLNSANEKMQTLTATLGNGITITNTYDSNNYFFRQQEKKDTTFILNNRYVFDNVKGNLTSRQNLAPGMGITENFTYDTLDRLTTWTNPATNAIDSNLYDNKGRITTNNKIGIVSYNTDATTGLYKKSKVALNAEGLLYYNTLGGNQNVSYTMFKSPISITESGKGKCDFEYNSHLERTKQLYDYGVIAPSTTKVQRKTKLYTDDGSTEVIYDNVAHTIKIITYVAGNAYSAVLYNDKTINTNTNATTENKYYLHRDYQGTILAISDNSGVAVEKRHFDAWGNLAKIVNASNIALPLVNGLVWLDRGYTGHEHLKEVGLIHMNGRLYDPVLRSFLMPDNFVQQPENTQNYNRYAYCLNNPLRYTDPSGELFGIDDFAAALIIGALIGGASYTLTALLADVPFSVSGLLTSTFIGAASASVMFGFGSAASSLFTQPAIGFWAGAAQGAITGSITGIAGTFVNAAFTGGNITLKAAFQGMVIGAAVGGIIGGIDGGLRADKMGLDFWSGEGDIYTAVKIPNSTASSGLKYENNTEMRADYNTNIGQVDGFSLEQVEDKLNTTVFLGQNDIGSWKINSDGLYQKGEETAGALTHTRLKGNFFRTPSSQITIAPGVKGFDLPIRNMVFKHEFMHAWHWSLGISEQNFIKYSERATSTYSLVYTKAYGYDYLNDLYRVNIANFPKPYGWKEFNKIIPVWLK